MKLADPETAKKLLGRYNRLTTQLSSDLGKRPMVLPTGEFFPDRFEPNAEGAQRLLERMQAHAGLTDVPLAVQVIADDGSAAMASSCSSGACAPKAPSQEITRLAETEEGWLITLSEGELRHPVGLTCNLARTLGNVLLLETMTRPEDIEPPFDVTVDLAAVALGFGSLILEGAYIYSKSCGGPSVSQLTKLNAGELAPIFVAFAEGGGHPLRKAQKELGTTQRALVQEAADWLATEAELRRELGLKKPGGTSFLGRLFRRKRSADELFEEAMAGNISSTELQQALGDEGSAPGARPLPTTQDTAQAQKRAELRALVDEAFSGE